MQQDLVTGGFIPRGEAQPQLVGLEGLHGDVGVPQAAYPTGLNVTGSRGAGGDDECACMCACLCICVHVCVTQVKLPHGHPHGYLSSHMAWCPSSWGHRSLWTGEKCNHQPLPWRACLTEPPTPEVTTVCFLGACPKVAPSEEPQNGCCHGSEALGLGHPWPSHHSFLQKLPDPGRSPLLRLALGLRGPGLLLFPLSGGSLPEPASALEGRWALSLSVNGDVSPTSTYTHGICGFSPIWGGPGKLHF